MNRKLIFVLILLSILILLMNYPKNLRERFQELSRYIGNVEVQGNASVKEVNGKKFTTKELCIEDVCIDKEQLNFIKKLPVVFKKSICIGETCLDEDDFKKIKAVTQYPINNIRKAIKIGSGGAHFAIKGGRTGKYCADEPEKVVCNRSRAAPWERFILEVLDYP